MNTSDFYLQHQVSGEGKDLENICEIFRPGWILESNIQYFPNFGMKLNVTSVSDFLFLTFCRGINLLYSRCCMLYINIYLYDLMYIHNSIIHLDFTISSLDPPSGKIEKKEAARLLHI